MTRWMMAVAALGGTSSCVLPHVCTKMYAPDGVTITVDGDVGVGAVEILVVGDDQTVVCRFELPSDDTQACDDDGSYVVMSEDGTRIETIALVEFAPGPFEIGLTLDGALLTEASLTPTVTIEEPNGEGCGEREVGEVTWVL